MEMLEMLQCVRGGCCKFGTIYRARCSVFVDHGYGRLNIVGEFDPTKSVLRIEIDSLSADLEQAPTERFVVSLEELMPLVMAALSSGDYFTARQPKKPQQGCTQVLGEGRSSA